MNFTDQHVLITGGSQGIGASLVHAFLDAGARVSTCALEPKATPELLEGVGPAHADRLHYLSCDLALPGAVDQLVASARGRFGPLNALVHNAAVVVMKSPHEATAEDFQRSMAVNVCAAWQLAVAATPDLARGAGAIVNMGSTNIISTRREHFPYNVTKGALSVLTKTLAVELGSQGIRVNSVLPGIIRTRHFDALVQKQKSPEEFARDVSRSHCLGSLPTTANVADAVLFLCSPAAAGITGAELVIDGGRQVKRYP